ncbi:hypothetical protein [Conexibacter sp. DBS9H8]|nr:hypothetical protein [Conexibacter sp. DBS9H8]
MRLVEFHSGDNVEFRPGDDERKLVEFGIGELEHRRGDRIVL